MEKQEFQLLGNILPDKKCGLLMVKRIYSNW